MYLTFYISPAIIHLDDSLNDKKGGALRELSDHL